jgi:hypothetical protein
VRLCHGAATVQTGRGDDAIPTLDVEETNLGQCLPFHSHTTAAQSHSLRLRSHIRALLFLSEYEKLLSSVLNHGPVFLVKTRFA